MASRTNVGTVLNESDGTASIDTGNAEAIGNDSETSISQVMNLGPYKAGFTLADQIAEIENEGNARCQHRAERRSRKPLGKRSQP